MTGTPYDVGLWLAKQVSDNHGRISDGDVLMWAGRAAQPIEKIAVDATDSRLHIFFKDVGTLIVDDSQQSCCERRYMSTDDDLSSFVGARLVHIDLASARNDTGGDFTVHEQQFMKFRTTNGDFTVVTHNEHNGYYGGLNPVIGWEDVA